MGHPERDESARSDYPDSKRSVSLRLNQSDYERIRTIAKRMRARESEVFRFLLRLALAEVAPLDNTRATGAELLPAFASYAQEFASHFQLDTRRIDRVINSGANPSNLVDEDDIELLAMAGAAHRYLAVRVTELTGKDVRPDDALPAMRDYLDKKYRQRPTVKTVPGDS